MYIHFFCVFCTQFLNADLPFSSFVWAGVATFTLAFLLPLFISPSLPSLLFSCSSLRGGGKARSWVQAARVDADFAFLLGLERGLGAIAGGGQVPQVGGDELEELVGLGLCPAHVEGVGEVGPCCVGLRFCFGQEYV